MNDSWSLVTFTILAQCAVGLSVFIALDNSGRHNLVRHAWVAIALLVVGTIFSLTHLASPLHSPYTITHLGSSWLSREILFAGLTGAVLLAYALFKKDILRWLAPVVGLAFIWVMSSVYLVPNQPQWNTWLTPAAFFSAALLLGGSLKLFLNLACTRDSAAFQRLDIMGWLVPLLSLLAIARLVFLLFFVGQLGQAPLLAVVQAVLLPLGAGFGLLCLTRMSARFVPHLGEEKGHMGWLCAALCVFLLIAAAEVCGRIVFYNSYTWFGM